MATLSEHGSQRNGGGAGQEGPPEAQHKGGLCGDSSSVSVVVVA